MIEINTARRNTSMSMGRAQPNLAPSTYYPATTAISRLFGAPIHWPDLPPTEATVCKDEPLSGKVDGCLSQLSKEASRIHALSKNSDDEEHNRYEGPSSCSTKYT